MIVFGFALLLGMGLIALWVRASSADIPPVIEGQGGVRMAQGLTGTFLPDEENTIIFNTAEARGVDARLLAAIRKAEMGGPGREFGVLSVSAPTYQDQATIAANTIRNNIARYEADRSYSATVNGRYTEEFIRYLGSVYAPVGAANDPTALNQNWVNNVNTWYRSIDYA